MRKTRFQQIVIGHLGEVKGGLLLSALCMIGFTVTEVLSPWPLKLIFDHVLLDRPMSASMTWLNPLLTQGKGAAVLWLSLSIVLIAGGKAVFSYFQLFITSRIGYQLVYALRRELFAHLARLSLTYHNRSRSGELLTKITSDTTTLKDVFAESALNFATQMLTLAGMITIMFMLNASMSLIVLATLPVLCFALFSIYRRIKTSARSQRERESRIASRISEVLRSVSLVQAFARERYEQERFDQESSETLTESIRTARMEAAASRTVEVVSAAGLCAVVLFGARQALAGRLSPGDVLIFASYLTSMYKPLRQLARLSSQFSKAMVSAERISEILETESEEQAASGAVRADFLQGSIVFHNVSFNYGSGKAALENVSFGIRPGERIALVGASGAGKSTIASLLLKFYEPQSGEIFIDGINLREYQRESLRRQIGVVLQDTILFGATIRENIAYGKPHATLDEVVAAARQAQAHAFIRSLPKAYETVLGERGSTISGGQRQRICLARALIKRPSILILDEPTSAIDPESAALIQESIHRHHEGKTMIVISHQFTGMERFDRIFVMRNGKIVEWGSHQKLVAQRGYYYELFRFQTRSGVLDFAEGRAGRIAHGASAS
ncbi:MAG: ABC transporter ATP-binding protein [Blastocatellia bacterium]|nr:ABC transporter ATP-binding protein [Blastocatellia bacterium]